MGVIHVFQVYLLQCLNNYSTSTPKYMLVRSFLYNLRVKNLSSEWPFYVRLIERESFVERHKKSEKIEAQKIASSQATSY
jgi:hypothetical protein